MWNSFSECKDTKFFCGFQGFAPRRAILFSILTFQDAECGVCVEFMWSL